MDSKKLVFSIVAIVGIVVGAWIQWQATPETSGSVMFLSYVLFAAALGSLLMLRKIARG